MSVSVGIENGGSRLRTFSLGMAHWPFGGAYGYSIWPRSLSKRLETGNDRVVQFIHMKKASSNNANRAAVFVKFPLQVGPAGHVSVGCDILVCSYAGQFFRSILRYAFTVRSGIRRK